MVSTPVSCCRYPGSIVHREDHHAAALFRLHNVHIRQKADGPAGGFRRNMVLACQRGTRIDAVPDLILLFDDLCGNIQRDLLIARHAVF